MQNDLDCHSNEKFIIVLILATGRDFAFFCVSAFHPYSIASAFWVRIVSISRLKKSNNQLTVNNNDNKNGSVFSAAHRMHEQ